MIKLGLHRQSGDADERFIAYVDRVRPQLVKQLDDRSNGLAAWCKERGVETVARVYFDDQNMGRIGDRIAKVVEEARTTSAIKYWELDNEDHQGGRDMARYADACITLMQALDALGQGQKAAIGSFSTGQPEIGEWVNFLPALKYAAAHNHAVAIHEYGGAVMQWGVGANQWNGGAYSLTDPCVKGDELGWWCLRYRRHVAEWRRLGLTTIPGIMITEGGLDDVQPRPGPQAKGYRDWVNTDWGHMALFGDYADQWAWYCRQMSRDPYMLGAVDYGFATRDPAWSSFDMSQDPAMLGRMVDAMTHLVPIGTPPPPPPPPPPPKDYVMYSQRDTRWASVPLGGVSGLTIGDEGCTLTCIAMLASRANPLLTPAELNIRLKRFGGFTPDGLIVWSRVAPATDNALAYKAGATWRDGPANIGVVATILKRGPALIQVDFKPITGTLDTHWVLGLRMTEDASDIVCADPWRGDECQLLKRYARPGWGLARAVYAIRELRAV